MNSRKTFNKSIFATLLLICFICAVFFIVSVNVDHMTTDACFDTLDDATVETASMVRANVENDREQLNVIADLLSQHDIHDIKTIKSHLASFRQRGTLSSIGLLLSDNQLILGMEEENIPEIALDYNTELKKAPYISGITNAADNTGKNLFTRQFLWKKMDRQRASYTVL